MENANRTTVIAGITALVVIVGILIFASRASNGLSKYDGFAQCLKNKGAVFYGAFWCKHCQNQKKMFGGAKKYLPYVECSAPDARSQLEICKQKGIRSYPTWVFSDMSSTTGEVPLEALSSKTACPLPN